MKDSKRMTGITAQPMFLNIQSIKKNCFLNCIEHFSRPRQYSGIFALCLLLPLHCFAQPNPWNKGFSEKIPLSKEEYKGALVRFNFEPIWVNSDHPVFGFTGANYQRLRIKLLSASRDSISNDTYHVVGKSKVKNNICMFKGAIRITHARFFQRVDWGCDEEYKHKGIRKEGILLAQYRFQEDPSNQTGGVFSGTLKTFWYIDKAGKIKYDNIDVCSDRYCNNQYVGTWTSCTTKIVKRCNWGDYRIPSCGDLDIGAGEFSPNEKYLKNGWKTYSEAVWNNNKRAKQEEDIEWWRYNRYKGHGYQKN